jgi:hypothetical protein
MHVATIVDKKRLSDGQIAVLVRCCNDPEQQSWHTLEVDLTVTADKIDQWLTERKQVVQDNHAVNQAADAHLESLILQNASPQPLPTPSVSNAASPAASANG